MDVPETPPRQTEDGLVAAGGGWFVLNARDARWTSRPGRQSVSFTGKTEFESDTYFPMLGVNLAVLEPGEPNSMYHWETETEAFLVLSGEALLIVEGEERPLRQWDFAYCPPKTEHVIVGAGDGPCVVLAMSSRERQAFGPYGAYTVDAVARRYGASPDEETQDTDVAGARVAGLGAVALSRRLASRQLDGARSRHPARPGERARASRRSAPSRARPRSWRRRWRDGARSGCSDGGRALRGDQRRARRAALPRRRTTISGSCTPTRRGLDRGGRPPARGRAGRITTGGRRSLLGSASGLPHRRGNRCRRGALPRVPAAAARPSFGPEPTARARSGDGPDTGRPRRGRSLRHAPRRDASHGRPGAGQSQPPDGPPSGGRRCPRMASPCRLLGTRAELSTSPDVVAVPIVPRSNTTTDSRVER